MRLGAAVFVEYWVVFLLGCSDGSGGSGSPGSGGLSGGGATTGGPPLGVEFAEVAAGVDIACGIALDGSVHCWGDEGIEQPPAGLTALVD